MYEMKDFNSQDGGAMLNYLNELPPHTVVAMVLDANAYWRVVVKVEKVQHIRKVRPKGWKPGDPYVEMS